jgi:hypothetical protein
MFLCALGGRTEFPSTKSYCDLSARREIKNLPSDENGEPGEWDEDSKRPAGGTTATVVAKVGVQSYLKMLRMNNDLDSKTN